MKPQGTDFFSFAGRIYFIQVLQVSILGIVKVFRQRQVSLTTMFLWRNVSLYEQEFGIVHISSKNLQVPLGPTLENVLVHLLQV